MNSLLKFLTIVLGLCIAVGAVLAVLAPVILLMALVRAYVLDCLWGWFAVGFFPVAELGMARAYGLALLIGCFTYQSTVRKKVVDGDGVKRYTVNNEDETGYIVTMFLTQGVFGPLVVLGVGKLVHSWFIL